jgi:hypothetical protein
MLTELKQYMNMITDIQGYKMNALKDLNNNINLKNLIIFGLMFPLCCIIIYYYIVIPRKSLLEGYLFMSLWTLSWDICLFSCFDKANQYLLLLLYDTFIVGGCSVLFAQYIVYNYYNYIKKYTILIFILWLLSFYLFIYKCYMYNPDLSNIKGVVLF